VKENLQSNLLWTRMELTARAAEQLRTRWQADGRPPTAIELRQLQVMATEQHVRRAKWRDARRAEGHQARENEPEAPRGTLRIQAAGLRSRAKVWIYGEIGPAGISADDLRRELVAIADSDPIDLHVNSDGGDYTEGLAMFTLLRRRRGSVYGTVDGLAASAATFPLMACERVEMTGGAMIMIHGVHGSLRNADEQEFVAAAESIRQSNEAIFQLYRARWTGTDDQLREALSKDTWLNADDAIAWGLADSISETLAVAAQVSGRFARKIPAQLTVAASARGNVGSLLLEMKLHRALCV
jgi:ATP-dependent protease ClpP protease subunit